MGFLLARWYGLKPILKTGKSARFFFFLFLVLCGDLNVEKKEFDPKAALLTLLWIRNYFISDPQIHSPELRIRIQEAN
jgi:hypothetical protein